MLNTFDAFQTIVTMAGIDPNSEPIADVMQKMKDTAVELPPEFQDNFNKNITTFERVRQDAGVAQYFQTRRDAEIAQTARAYTRDAVGFSPEDEKEAFEVDTDVNKAILRAIDITRKREEEKNKLTKDERIQREQEEKNRKVGEISKQLEATKAEMMALQRQHSEELLRRDMDGDLISRGFQTLDPLLRSSIIDKVLSRAKQDDYVFKVMDGQRIEVRLAANETERPIKTGGGVLDFGDYIAPIVTKMVPGNVPKSIPTGGGDFKTPTNENKHSARNGFDPARIPNLPYK